MSFQDRASRYGADVPTLERLFPGPWPAEQNRLFRLVKNPEAIKQAALDGIAVDRPNETFRHYFSPDLGETRAEIAGFGISISTYWRGQQHLACPVTLVRARTGTRAMIPIAALLSDDDPKHLEPFLRAVSRRLPLPVTRVTISPCSNLLNVVKKLFPRAHISVPYEVVIREAALHCDASVKELESRVIYVAAGREDEALGIGGLMEWKELWTKGITTMWGVGDYARADKTFAELLEGSRPAELCVLLDQWVRNVSPVDWQNALKQWRDGEEVFGDHRRYLAIEVRGEEMGLEEDTTSRAMLRVTAASQ
ncbi:uncharacterized protein MKK02DRAFT_27863 [Dioszegia hungarica]|uniref:Uncharacterized protein n=1 Tax=Dioszegia hungarica TaxID=4972 RepID=A0AA38H689_9TREE|nr:uncharacterized protein MKK02DRAFT_27863 [Dioszegia hungarica]KAI9634703.1 hypothetical protein MKK02DRAFT_27863 [Dioszegia hungarica]